jgi:transposase
MDHYAGIDVSLEYSSVCVVNASGKIVREGKVLSEPAALIAWFASLGRNLTRIGLEAGPLSQWLFAAMRNAALAVELLETRQGLFSLARRAQRPQDDAGEDGSPIRALTPVFAGYDDARGIAELMRLGWHRPVHCKSLAAQETRALLTTRDLVQSKLHSPP